MSSGSDARSAIKRQTGGTAAPYVLCDLLKDIPLAEDGSNPTIKITCVEFWDGNLYIGTSAAEILHYVLIPAAAGDPSQSPTFILASRLRLDYAEAGNTASGVERILILPRVSKACILCNGTLNFYVLPELSPAYGGSRKVPRCTYVGGVDQDPEHASSAAEGEEVMICDNSRIRIVRIGQKATPVRAIQLGGCRAVVRKGSIACAADVRSYSLLEVVEQQAIPLFELCPQGEQRSVPDPAPAQKALPSLPLPGEAAVGQSESSAEPLQSITAGGQSPERAPSGHAQAGETEREEGPKAESAFPPRVSSLILDESSHERSESRPSSISQPLGRLAPEPRRDLEPHIVSPTGSEFLLITGTSMRDEGVGIFVNLDGDVVRGTLQFSRYPEALIGDGGSEDTSTSTALLQPQTEGYVLAVVDRSRTESPNKTVEMQRWDFDPSETPFKHYLDVLAADHAGTPSRDSEESIQHLGLGISLSTMEVPMPAVVQCLNLRPCRMGPISQPQDLNAGQSENADRKSAESDFVLQISQASAHILLWTHGSVWWVVRTPAIMRFDYRLDSAVQQMEDTGQQSLDRAVIERIVDEIRDQEALNELDFLSFKYIRQKASVLLFMDLVRQTASDVMTYERDRRTTLEVLIQGEVDPRLITATVPELRDDVDAGRYGIWLPNGIAQVAAHYFAAQEEMTNIIQRERSVTSICYVIKDYLTHWRRKKGFGSITDESEVFKSVDAALLHLLLIMDAGTPPGRARPGSIRTELNALVNEGVDCFDYAVELLERYQRLYILSLLYMNRRQFAKVLATWKRVVEGEPDQGGELGNGEEEIRSFLRKRNDRKLVEEYGIWLAHRNPKLGVRVFAESTSRIKFEPKEAIQLMKDRVPEAVKAFLEHLVFEDNLPQHANDLIGYYLDSVLTELETSEDSRSLLRSSNQAYRALNPPKPTYSQFVTDNGVDADWWRNRLRLLQLLGGSHGAASQYDVQGILARLERYKEMLLPESIVLSGRQGHHAEAIRLLTHGLGDFDTAISYCILGGSSTYSPLSSQQRQRTMPSREEQRALFRHLLEEFFLIEDLNDRITQTSELLERFSAWFDISHVLNLVPNSWSVDKLSPFFESSLRELLTERNECVINRALTSCANLTANAVTVEKLSSLGVSVDRVAPDHAT